MALPGRIHRRDTRHRGKDTDARRHHSCGPRGAHLASRRRPCSFPRSSRNHWHASCMHVSTAEHTPADHAGYQPSKPSSCYTVCSGIQAAKRSGPREAPRPRGEEPTGKETPGLARISHPGNYRHNAGTAGKHRITGSCILAGETGKIDEADEAQGGTCSLVRDEELL